MNRNRLLYVAIVALVGAAVVIVLMWVRLPV
jgi:hypothetical protein